MISPKSGPATDGAAITPSDTVDMTTPARGIYVGTGGNVKLITVAGSTLTFVSVPSGYIIPMQTKRVFSTLTTASNMIALY
jgi:hypothetical protein